ncbi:hypothetical protein [Flavobacterium pectinovorum]|uniref:hypothetical protein n=1 Tax=Flavobacterium pectinovorum TaxID=29533 RepID=UPI001FABA4C4|nr:hypothetical protein [Flavobacterium pectinovorum]MCI9845500.1 hypothetical protein [Flavobacterium pectinovorum]
MLWRIEYKYRFFDLGNGRSGIAATYKFKMRSRTGVFFFKLFAEKYLKKHIGRYLNSIVKDVERYGT